MCKGHFVFGDVESGAMMRMDVKFSRKKKLDQNHANPGTI
jgi:hypothetical protein